MHFTQTLSHSHSFTPLPQGALDTPSKVIREFSPYLLGVLSGDIVLELLRCVRLICAVLSVHHVPTTRWFGDQLYPWTRSTFIIYSAPNLWFTFSKTLTPMIRVRLVVPINFQDFN